MSGQHANIKGAALTVSVLLARLLTEARAELAAERQRDGRHHARRTTQRTLRPPSTA